MSLYLHSMTVFKQVSLFHMICIHILDVIIWSLPPWILSNLFGRRITLFELETVWINKSSQYILLSEVSIYFCLKNHLEWFPKVKSYGRLTHPPGHTWKWKIVSYQSIRKLLNLNFYIEISEQMCRWIFILQIQHITFLCWDINRYYNSGKVSLCIFRLV